MKREKYYILSDTLIDVRSELAPIAKDDKRLGKAYEKIFDACDFCSRYEGDYENLHFKDIRKDLKHALKNLSNYLRYAEENNFNDSRADEAAYNLERLL